MQELPQLSGQLERLAQRSRQVEDEARELKPIDADADSTALCNGLLDRYIGVHRAAHTRMKRFVRRPDSRSAAPHPVARAGALSDVYVCWQSVRSRVPAGVSLGAIRRRAELEFRRLLALAAAPSTAAASSASPLDLTPLIRFCRSPVAL